MVVLLAIANNSIAAGDEDKVHSFSAFSWASTAVELTNVTPFFWLGGEALTNREFGVEKALETLKLTPAGKRAMISSELLSTLHRHPQDFLQDKKGYPSICIDKDGTVRWFPSVWWENGAEVVRKSTQDWFQRYKELGGKVDYLILDYEEDSSYRHLFHRLPHPEGFCGIAAYLDALKRDPRFAILEPELQGRDIAEMLTWDRNDTALVWRKVAMELTASYIEQAVFEPVRQVYPQVAFSNYGFYAQAPEFSLPSRFGQFLHRYGTGRHVGTHQSAALYGWVGREGAVSLSDGTTQAPTPFNAMRTDVNILRGMRMSSAAPIFPWIAYKGFSESLLRDNDLYQEQLYHVLLGGVDKLLFWNPRLTDPPATEADDRLLSQLMQRVDLLSGNLRPQPLDLTLASWSKSYVLTTARAGNRQLWRFTPDPDLGKKPTDYVLSYDPLTLEIDGELLRFPCSELARLEPQLSTAGLWIVKQDADQPGS